MIERRTAGRVPPKPHTAFRDEGGRLLYEECFTRAGFDGPYTMAYHQQRPHTAVAAQGPEVRHGFTLPAAAPARALAKRHYRSQELRAPAGPAMDGRIPLLFNADVVLSIVRPDAPDPVYFANADGDDLYFVFQGGGTLRSALGDVGFGEGDYLHVPKGLLHRLIPSDARPQHWLSIECLGGMTLPRQWRNEVGQLRMDAPYTHRDFRGPVFAGPSDEGIRHLLVKRGGAFHGYVYDHAPLDVVGWDGTVYPWAFPILAFQPRVSSIHLPPTWHGTFAARGALICSFVPRLLDFHPDAIPCPYPHASVDCDEFLFYCKGNFTSRRGVGPGSISHHPAGVMHGPHPGAYEGSIGAQRTDELAVMLDTYAPLQATAAALSVEDPDYERSFLG
jgi:homogentisate 1,2-dioxygenase